MALLAFNMTTAPVALAAGGVVLPASAVAGARGPAYDVTSELSGLLPAQYVALEAQRLAGTVVFQWDESVEYQTGDLKPDLAIVPFMDNRNDPATGTTTLDVFVDGAAGNDDNPGTAASPMKTLGAVQRKYTPMHLSGNRLIVNLMSNGALQQTYNADSTFFFGGQEPFRPPVSVRGPQMVPFVAASGPVSGIVPNKIRTLNTTGTGDSFSFAAGVVTLTDAAGLFDASDVGKTIVIAGATSAANNGSFVIASFISATQITYANAGGVAEAYTGAWTIQNGALDASGVSFIARTEIDFTTAAPGWTVDDFAGRAFLRIIRAGALRTFEMPISENTASKIYIDNTDLAGQILTTDTFEIVYPGARIVGPAPSYTFTFFGDSSFRAPVSGDKAFGGIFERIAFGPIVSRVGNISRVFDRCTFDRFTGVGGAAASTIAGAAAGSMRVTGLTGMTADVVGMTLELSGSVNPGNNGFFAITNFVNDTTVDVSNAGAVVPDAGPINWILANGFNTIHGGALAFVNCAARTIRFNIETQDYITAPNLLSRRDTSTAPAVIAVSGRPVCVSLSAYDTLLLVGGIVFGPVAPNVAPAAANFAAGGPAAFVIHSPLTLRKAPVPSWGGALTAFGGSQVVCRSNGAILGDLNAAANASGCCLRARTGAQIRFIATSLGITSSGSPAAGRDVAVEDGVGVSKGTAAGQLMESAANGGFNGNVIKFNASPAIKRTFGATAVGVAGFDITALTPTAPAGAVVPPIRTIRTLRVTASDDPSAVGSYMLTDAGGTPQYPGATTFGIATISDDGKTLFFKALNTTDTVSFIIEYEPNTVIGPVADASRIFASLS